MLSELCAPKRGIGLHVEPSSAPAAAAHMSQLWTDDAATRPRLSSPCGWALFYSALIGSALLGVSGLTASAQTSTTLSQTVNKRNTIGALTASPSTGLTAGASVTFSYTLHTAGAPAPTTETVQFMDGSNAIGSAQTIGSVSASNILPYSQISAANNWTATGTAPTLTPNSVTGPDGSASTATQVAFPSTTSTPSAITASVPGTSYASKAMTFSVWAQSATPTTLTLTLADSPSVAASNSNTCAVTSAWQRCILTYAFPANAGTGFAATVSSVGQAAQTINLWGAQVEQASAPTPYVSTIGTARPSGAQGGSISFPYAMFHQGSHSITAVYSGDTNYIGSTSNAAVLTVAKATPTIALASSPASTSAYGQNITLTATLTGPSSFPTDTPTGTAQFFDGAISLGTGPVNSSGVATLTLSGSTSLPAGSHTLTVVYSGDTEFNTVTSAALSYTVTKASGVATISVTSSSNPSIYGDSVSLTVTLASSSGATPTGTATITDGGTSLGTVTLNASGTGTLTVPLFTAGTHSLTITYSGDSNYN